MQLFRAMFGGKVRSEDMTNLRAGNYSAVDDYELHPERDIELDPMDFKLYLHALSIFQSKMRRIRSIPKECSAAYKSAFRSSRANES